MRQEIRKFLHDKIAELLSLPLNKVIWANQGGYKQVVPLVTLMSYSERSEAMADVLPTATPGEYELLTPTAFVLEVQYFGGKSLFPVDILSDFVSQFSRPTVVDSFMAAGVAFVYADPVQDIVTLLGNNQQFEPRAVVDLHLRYTARVLDTPGIIDTVDILGHTPRDLEFTVTTQEE